MLASDRVGSLKPPPATFGSVLFYLCAQPWPPGSPSGLQPQTLLGSLRASVASQAGDLPGQWGQPSFGERALGLAWLWAAGCRFTSAPLSSFGANLQRVWAGGSLTPRSEGTSGETRGWRALPGRPGWVGEPAPHHPCGLCCGPICIILKLIGLKATSLNHS